MHNFDLPTLQDATENFSMNNKLGEGGFGTVYKGVLSDGQEIAVKKLLGRAGHGLDQLHNENGSLDNLLFDNSSGNALNWKQQYNIILGIAKGIVLLGEGHTQTRTARVVGTFGYMPPEYLARGSVSTKIDIFSFGVLVLEIVTRRSNCRPEVHDSVNLLSDVWNCWTKGTVSQMIDQSLDEYSQSQARRCIHIGLLCVQPDPDDRPHISSVISC
ncbi:hypothetical protein GUJ93_ZPchr0007g5148 [Zizania palustris]|uniref:Protein kinase domain-containing protein n=1 Tax=Zizania palustris TaxID=103762 RepID=A0A8J5T8F7_ZIZPA|nr:hypothetical protein GUJ93_ZPchr0007g5148 [Zizania palustris]